MDGWIVDEQIKQTRNAIITMIMIIDSNHNNNDYSYNNNISKHDLCLELKTTLTTYSSQIRKISNRIYNIIIIEILIYSI